MSLAAGDQIPIEERDPSEVTTPYGAQIVPGEFKALNPAFDVTPQAYLCGIVTEYGVARPPFIQSLARAKAGQQL